jgi:hypothetical protein
MTKIADYQTRRLIAYRTKLSFFFF